MGNQLLHSQDYLSMLNRVIENEMHSESTVKNETLWVEMGVQLEIEGVEKSQISAIVRKDIEDMLYEKQFKDLMPRNEYKWHSGHFWRIMKNNNYVNPEMARNVKDSDVDPSRDQENSSINTKNKEFVDIFYDVKEVCNLAIQKLKDMQEFDDIIGKKESKEFYRQLRMITSNCKYAFDDKTKIPKNTEHVLLKCLATSVSSINIAAKKFLQIRVDLLDDQQKKFFTMKQVSKFQHGDKASKLLLLKPDSRDTAIFGDYIGVQCEDVKCKSWRIRKKLDSNNVECFDCGLEFTAKTVSKCPYCQTPLYKENLKKIIKTEKCSDCGTFITLPQELINYAKN